MGIEYKEPDLKNLGSRISDDKAGSILSTKNKISLLISGVNIWWKDDASLSWAFFGCSATELLAFSGKKPQNFDNFREIMISENFLGVLRKISYCLHQKNDNLH